MWHSVPFARQRCPVVGVLRMCWLLPGSFDCFCCPHTFVHRPSIACLAVFLCAPGALVLNALSKPSTICAFPPHGWSAPDGLPLLLRKQPIWAAGDTPHLMPVEQGLPWHPVATGLAGWPGHPLYCRCLPCARSTIRSILVPCSRCSGCLSCLAVPLLLVCCARPCPSWCGSRVLCVCVAPPPVGRRSWVPMSRTPSCPTRLPPPYEDFTSPYDVDCPVCSWLFTALLPPPWRAPPGARGATPALVEYVGTL